MDWNPPPHHRPDLLFVDDGVHHSTNCFHYCSSTNCFHRLTHFLSMSDLGSTSGGLGSIIWDTPLSIKNLNNRVRIVQRKLSWKSFRKWSFMLSYNVLLSIACSLQNLSIIFLNHSNRFVLPPFQSVCINCRFFCWFMNIFSEIFEVLEEFLVSFGEKFCLCLNETQFIFPCVILYIIVNLPLPPLSDVFFTYHLHVLFQTWFGKMCISLNLELYSESRIPK